MSNSIDVFTDSRHFLEGGKWSCAATDIVANFPACKLFFCKEDVANGGATWTDRVGSVVLTDATGFEKDAIGVRRQGLVTITSGTLPVMGAKEFVLIWTGTVGAASHTLGVGDTAANGPGLSIIGNGSQYIVRDTNQYVQSAVLGTPPTYPAAGSICLHADTTANEARKYFSATGGTTTSSVKSATTGTIAGTWAAFTAEMEIPNSALGGIETIALLAFTTPPADTDIEIANQWMAANPGKLYPLWAGRT